MTYLGSNPPAPRAGRDPLHLLIAGGVIVVAVVGLILIGTIALKVLTPGGTGSTTAWSCEQLDDQIAEVMPEFAAAPNDSPEQALLADDLVQLAAKKTAQDCPPS